MEDTTSQHIPNNIPNKNNTTNQNDLYDINDITDIINKYNNLTYFDQYGGSIVLCVLTTIIIMLLTSYFHTIINAQPVINDWANQRCKPAIIPFAGLINPPEGVSASDYTYENFNYCTQNILADVADTALEPLSYITNVLTTLTGGITEDIQSSRGMFDKVRTYIQDFVEEIMGRFINVIVPLMQTIRGFNDLVARIQGVLTSGLYMLLGFYYAFKSLLGSIAQFIIAILITMSISIAILWTNPFTMGLAAANTIIFMAIVIPLALILSFMSKSLHISTKYEIPKLKCFDKNTLIQMNNLSYKKIIDIKIGEVLFNNNIVTAKMKLERKGSVMYILNDVVVSDTHIVKFNNTWIPVSKHPNSIKHNSYIEPYLYCLNTTNKIIEINQTVFTDWDELYDDSLAKIISNPLILDHDITHIHKYLDYGFSSNTKIKLNNNKTVNLNQINVNDMLENGETVYGIVVIDGINIANQFHYCLGDNKDGVEGYAPNMFNCKKHKLVQKHDQLYHLLTDKGTFMINNVIIKDYNEAIDSIFSKNYM
jgi:hypothetical protein